MLLEKKLEDLKSYFLNNGDDKIREKCLDMRIDIDLATEKRILLIQEQRDQLIKEIDVFENECLKILGRTSVC